MSARRTVSPTTRNNWMIDAVMFTSAILVSLSSIYFLALPVGGYQGGRNPYYGIQIIFERHTWEDLHNWGGIAMILIAAVHITLHWSWIVNMTRRVIGDLIGGGKRLNNRSRFNAAINAVIGVSFLIAAISGVYLLFFPGGAHGVPDPRILFARSIWDLIHTWSGIAMILAALVHFAIHWKWVTKVTGKVFGAAANRLIPSFPKDSATLSSDKSGGSLI